MEIVRTSRTRLYNIWGFTRIENEMIARNSKIKTFIYIILLRCGQYKSTIKRKIIVFNKA